MPLEQKYLDLISAAIPHQWNSERLHLLSALYDRVVETNARINITSLTSPIDVTLKHLIDSLSLFSYSEVKKAFDEKKSICDVGCGGGFPGLPLACVYPDSPITMIDSTEKKITALRENAQLLNLPCVTPVWGRGEELAGKSGMHRERYDLCVSRAVAALPVLCELCVPFVKQGGLFVAMKGMKAMEELEESRRAIPMLGAVLKEVVEIHWDASNFDLSVFTEEEQEKIVNFCEAKRFLIVIEKKKMTLTTYPRKWSQMVKKPL